MIKRWWWNVRYAFIMWRLCWVGSLSFCWQSAKGGDAFDDDYTPSEAVDSEMSYWGD